MTNVLSPVNNSVMSFLTNAQQVVCHCFNCSIEFPSMMWNVSFIHINLPFYTPQYCWWTCIDMTGHPMYKLKSLTILQWYNVQYVPQLTQTFSLAETWRYNSEFLGVRSFHVESAHCRDKWMCRRALGAKCYMLHAASQLLQCQAMEVLLAVLHSVCF